jgi:YidC/Oxa1 family membrane protein insertase
LNRLQPDEWEYLFNGVFYDLTRSVPGQLESIRQLYEQKNNIEIFFGLNIIETAGWGFPGILIPILAVITTFLTSWFSMKMTAATNKDNPQAKMQQRMMMFVMPIMMGFFTFNIPIGVGIFWITSSVFQVVQQAILNKRTSNSSEEKIIDGSSKK